MPGGETVRKNNQGMAWQGRARQGKARHGKARQGYVQHS